MDTSSLSNLTTRALIMLYYDDPSNESKERQEINRLKKECKRLRSHAILLAASNISGLIICIGIAASNGAYSQKFFLFSFGDVAFSLGIIWFWINAAYLFIGAPSTKELNSKLTCICASIIVLLSLATMFLFYRVILPY